MYGPFKDRKEYLLKVPPTINDFDIKDLSVSQLHELVLELKRMNKAGRISSELFEESIRRIENELSKRNSMQ